MGDTRVRRSRPVCFALSAVGLMSCLIGCTQFRCTSTFVPATIANGDRQMGSRVHRNAVQGFDGSQGKRQPKRVKTSAGMVTLTPALVEKMGAQVNQAELRAAQRMKALRVLRFAGGSVTVMVALLYITSIFERLMHSASGLLSGGSTWVAAAAGLAVGALHTVSGPDHLAALAPLVVGQGRSTAIAFGLGALWGSGHATGQLLIGLACLAVHAGLVATHWAEAIGQTSGFLVGLSLVGIGLLGFHEARGYKDSESHSHEAEAGEAKGRPGARRFGWATYCTGVLHGLSPDALVFIAPALALPRLGAIFHVAGVVLGTLISMGCCTAALSAVSRRSPQIKSIANGASSVAMMLGICIIAAEMGVSVRLPGL